MKTDFGWDLPPGVSANDIPGNRAEDIKLDMEYDELTGIVYDQIEELLESLQDFARNKYEYLQKEHVQEILRNVVNDLAK